MREKLVKSAPLPLFLTQPMPSNRYQSSSVLLARGHYYLAELGFPG